MQRYKAVLKAPTSTARFASMLLFFLVILVSVLVNEGRFDPSVKFNVTAEGQATCDGNRMLAAKWNVSLKAVRFSK